MGNIYLRTCLSGDLDSTNSLTVHLVLATKVPNLIFPLPARFLENRKPDKGFFSGLASCGCMMCLFSTLEHYIVYYYIA